MEDVNCLAGVWIFLDVEGEYELARHVAFPDIGMALHLADAQRGMERGMTVRWPGTSLRVEEREHLFHRVKGSHTAFRNGFISLLLFGLPFRCPEISLLYCNQ